MTKIEILSLASKAGESVTVSGWVNNIRSHGNIAFIDLRDRSGILQVFVGGKELIEKVKQLNIEDLISVRGSVQGRPAKLVNSNLATGKIELSAEKIEIISKCAPLPFEIDKNTVGINEQARLKYRYLDLRSERMKNNMRQRHIINLFLRNYFSQQGFWEIETPFLTKGTPEGAREFIIPSRLHSGNFYVLPQSPQQFKQLLMVGGMEKYFQIVKCFRDEDQRNDRQPEFTQFDLEMSFIDQEDIICLMEKAVIDLIEKLFPDKKIKQTPFPRLTYKEAMDKYKSDKPDLRESKDSGELAFCWVVDFPMFEYSETEKKFVACHHPFTRPKDEDLKLLDSNHLDARAQAYDLVLNGFEVGGGSLRIFEKELQEKVFKILGLDEKEIQERFGHMLEAFSFSPPPHGGIALGLDRLIALLVGEASIREVMAFPKTGDAKELLTGAPSSISAKALKEAHIKIEKDK